MVIDCPHHFPVHFMLFQSHHTLFSPFLVYITGDPHTDQDSGGRHISSRLWKQLATFCSYSVDSTVPGLINIPNILKPRPQAPWLTLQEESHLSKICFWSLFGLCPCEYRDPRRQEEGILVPGARVIGVCELPSMSAGNQTRVFGKNSVCAVVHRGRSPAHVES